MTLTHHLTISLFFFFNDTATTEIYTLSLHDALPICRRASWRSNSTTSRPDCLSSAAVGSSARIILGCRARARATDRKSTRLNSSHSQISYAVFCLKKKKQKYAQIHETRTAATVCSSQ